MTGHPYFQLMLDRAAQMGALGGDRTDPLRTARLAWQLGEHDLGRALLARSGGLLDTADARRALTEPLPDNELAMAATQLGAAPRAPAWTDTQREMFIRGLAGFLLCDDPRRQDLPGAHAAPVGPGVFVLPARSDVDRWTAGLQALYGGAAPAAGAVPPSTWASASWGGRWGLTRLLAAHARAAGGPGTDAGPALPAGVSVDATEQLIATLSAAYTWNLPRLVPLLSRPLLIDAPHGLGPAQLDVLSTLLDDAAVVFGWTVLILPGIDRAWPAAFQPALDADPTPGGRRPPTVHVQSTGAPQTLEQLARHVAALPGRTLIVLPTRGSAARLTGLLPGADLLSTSLSPVHLGRVADALVRAEPGTVRHVIATTLPPSTMLRFDHVYHLAAPLPFLAEAAQLCDGDLHVLTLLDVAVPLAWRDQVRETMTLLEAHPDALVNPAWQRAYFAALHAGGTDARADDLIAHRRALDYASFAASMMPRAEHSVPVLVPADDEAREAIARYRASGWLPTASLRYAAWLTPSEALRAVRDRDAEPAGWPLIWTAPYHPTYGLAARTVAEVQADN